MRLRHALLPAAALAVLILVREGSLGARGGSARRAVAKEARTGRGRAPPAEDTAAAPDPEPDTGDLPGWTTAGRVIGPDGAPVAGASVELEPWGIEWVDIRRNLCCDAPVVEHAATGPDGCFGFCVKGPFDAWLRVSAPGFADVERFVDAGDEEIVVQLGCGARASGRVCLPDGSPAIGASVWAAPRRSAEPVGPSGEFALEGLTPGYGAIDAVLSASAQVGGVATPVEYQASVYGELSADQPCEGLVLRLDLSAVALEVRRPDGSPLADADVRVTDPAWRRDIATDARGAALIAFGSPAGTEVSASVELDVGGGKLSYELRFRTSPPDAPETVRWKLREPRRVSLAVTGLPASLKDHVWIYVSDGLRLPGRSVVLLPDEDARTFEAGVAGFFVVSDRTIPPAATDVEVRFAPKIPVTGRVSGGSPHRPLYASWSGPTNQVFFNPTSEVAENGWFLVHAEPGPGEITVHTSCPLPMEIVLLRRDVVVEPGRVVDLGELQLPPVRRITGRVVAPDGRPAGGTQVLVLARETGVVGYTRARGDGSFSVDAPWPGEMRVALWKNGVGAWLSDALRRPPEESLDCALEPEAWLEIQHGSAADVETSDGFRLHPARPFVTLGADLIALTAGPHRVVLNAENGSVTEQTVELVSGSSVHIDLK